MKANSENLRKVGRKRKEEFEKEAKETGGAELLEKEGIVRPLCEERGYSGITLLLRFVFNLIFKLGGRRGGGCSRVAYCAG